MFIILNRRRLKKTAIALLCAAFFCAAAGSVSAAETTGAVITQTTTAPDMVTVENSDTQTLGSVTFRASNSERVPVGKSTTLYIKIEDMKGTVTTAFSCSNPSIATIEKVNNVSVRVTGVKEGEVVITATAGGKSAKYTLIVGEAKVTSAPTQAQQTDPAAETTVVPVDFSMGTQYQDQILALAEQERQADAGNILLGVIGLVAIVAGLGSVVSVMLSNGTPKLTLYPGSRRRFNAGTGKGRSKKRLLPDHYYRNVKKH